MTRRAAEAPTLQDLMRRNGRVHVPELDLGGDGTPLAFLHANGYPPECYRTLLDRFRQDFRVRAMRLRPLWEAPSEARKLSSWHALSFDFLDWLDMRVQQPAVAVGHSLGAVVALRAALHEPIRFRALVLLDPVLLTRAHIVAWRLARRLPFGHPLQAVIRRTQKRRSVFRDSDEVFRAYRRYPVFRELTDERLKEVIQGLLNRRGAQVQLQFSPTWEAQIYRTAVWNDLDIWDGLSALGIPILIVRGAESQTLTPAACAAAADLNALIQSATLERATHLLPFERPVEVHQLANRFIEQALTPRTAEPGANAHQGLTPT